MSIKLKKYNHNKESKRAVKELYFSAFPKEEQAPYILLKLLSKKKSVNFFSAYDKKEFIGLAYVISHKDTAYLFFLAIDKNKRNKGYGSQILSALKEKYKDYRIMLAIEEIDQKYPNIEQRLKRKDFYFRNGFYDLNFKMTEKTVTYDMLGYNRYGKTIDKKEYFDLIHSCCGKFLYKHFIAYK